MADDKRLALADSEARVAFDLMDWIGRKESTARGAEQNKREYWLTLYGDCRNSVRGPGREPSRP